MQNTLAKALLLTLPLALAGCWESERDCYTKLAKELTDFELFVKENYGPEEYKQTQYDNIGTSMMLQQILSNEDLNVCDYTLLNKKLIKID